MIWVEWKLIAPAMEDYGFSGLCRSDYFVEAAPPNVPSLDL
jgi:hypothetical protein